MIMPQKINILTMHVCTAFAARVYVDSGRQNLLLLDREIDYLSYRRYELSDDPDLALRIEYTAYYNAVQTVLARLVRVGRVTGKDAARGYADWLAAHPIPAGLPRTPLSTAFCPIPDQKLNSSLRDGFSR